MNRSDLPGLYIHVPFCKTKCPYCDFYSVTDTKRAVQWLSTTLMEASLYREEFPFFDSLYIGGGTPSLLGGPLLEDLLCGLRDIFRFDGGTELTMEVNPDDVTREKLALYRALGVNRISLGVQSFREDEVRFLGRRHSAKQAEEALGFIAGEGFAEFGIDLIYGLPGQTLRSWRQTLRKALEHGPSHISCYQLTLEGDTPFSRMSGGGSLKLPADAIQARFSLAASETLSEAGFIHYEVSNFARGLEHLSRHNVKYWQHTPYLGIGPSAHSFRDNRRWWNARCLDEHVLKTDRGEKATGGSERLSPEQMRLERLLFGFRTLWGVEMSEISGKDGQKAIDGLLTSRLVELHETRIIPTEKGYLFADGLPVMVSG